MGAIGLPMGADFESCSLKLETGVLGSLEREPLQSFTEPRFLAAHGPNQSES